MDEREETTGRLVRLREGWSDVAARPAADEGNERPTSGGRAKESLSSGLVIGVIAGALVLVLCVVAFISRSNPVATPPPRLMSLGVRMPQAPQTEERCFLPSQDGAVIAGWVKYSGPSVTPVDPKTLKTLEDTITAYSDPLVVNPNGTLCNVLVYIQSAVQVKSTAAPLKPMVMNATPIDFFPHVLAVQVGHNVDFRNSDVVLHTWNLRSIANPPALFGQPMAGMVSHRSFGVPEIPIPVRSDLYPYMSAYICVIGHPYFNVTNAAGLFRLEALPPGTYTIESWHERLGTTQQTLTVKDGELAKITITY